MSGAETLSSKQFAQLREVAVTLIPGDATSPSIDQLPDYDNLIQLAVEAVGVEIAMLHDGLDALPSVLDWASLSAFSDAEPAYFELISSVVVGAYYISPTALESVGWPTGQRQPAPFDQAVNELGYGILDPVLARELPERQVPNSSGGSS